MTDEPDPDKLKGPGGLTLRQIHEQVQKSVERDGKERKPQRCRSVERQMATLGTLRMGSQRPALAIV